MYKLKLGMIIIGLLLSSSSLGQTLQFIQEVPLPYEPIKISSDRYNNFFVADTKGNLYKYDSTAKYLFTYSPPKMATISLVEAWQTLRVFLFYKEFQEYTILDRFLTPTAENLELDKDKIGFARIATLAADGNLWLFDEVDFSIKKYNPQLKSIMVRTACDLLLNPQEYNINFIREYQNLLLINDKNSGILVFDNLGNYKKKIPINNLDYLGIDQESLYFLEKDKINFYNLYTQEQTFIDAPILPNPIIYSLKQGKKLIFLTKTSIVLFEIK